jgi:hypothetical protein
MEEARGGQRAGQLKRGFLVVMNRLCLMKSGVIVNMELGPSSLHLIRGERSVAIISIRLTQFQNWIWLSGVSIGLRWPPAKYLAKFVNLNSSE